jgi:uncharacterized protein (TIGR00297 family)
MPNLNLALPSQWPYGLALVIIFTILSYATKRIDASGAISGGFLTACLLLGAGIWGLIILGAFFIVGSLASVWKIHWKQQVGLAEPNKAKRSAIHAFSNGGVAAICGLLAWMFPAKSALFQVMLAASMASAMADTLASELGNVYGSRYVNILTFRPEPRGLDGVVSGEGTLLGAAGSILIACIYGLGFGWEVSIIIVALSGMLGNWFDSVLGATLQRKGSMNNHAVNFANTLFAALFAFLLS